LLYNQAHEIPLSRSGEENQDGPFEPDRYSGRAWEPSGAGELRVVEADTKTAAAAAAVEQIYVIGVVGAGTCSVEPPRRGEERALAEAYAVGADAWAEVAGTALRGAGVEKLLLVEHRYSQLLEAYAVHLLGGHSMPRM
jgi:hypothetical protein